MHEYFACMYVCAPCVSPVQRPEDNIGFPGAGVACGYELLCGIKADLGSSKRAANIF